MRAMPIALALILSAGTVGAVQTAQKATSLKEAAEAVRKDKASPEGNAWESQLAPWLGPALTPTAQSCKETVAKKGKPEPFTVYLRLSKAGAVLESLVTPETPYTKCIRDGVAKLTYPNVPREGFWFEIGIKPRPPK